MCVLNVPHILHSNIISPPTTSLASFPPLSSPASSPPLNAWNLDPGFMFTFVYYFLNPWPFDPGLLDLFSLLSNTIDFIMSLTICLQIISACPLFGFDTGSDRPPASPMVRFREFFITIGK